MSLLAAFPLMMFPKEIPGVPRCSPSKTSSASRQVEQTKKPEQTADVKRKSSKENSSNLLQSLKGKSDYSRTPMCAYK